MTKPKERERTGEAAQNSLQEIERIICEIWSVRFGRMIGPDDDFYELGGDSITVVEFVAEARERGIPLRSSTALRNPTPALLAAAAREALMA